VRAGALVIALGDVSVTKRRITMTHTRYAFVEGSSNADVVGRRFDDAFRTFLACVQCRAKSGGDARCEVRLTLPSSK
jgi:hypothetical protein